MVRSILIGARRLIPSGGFSFAGWNIRTTVTVPSEKSGTDIKSERCHAKRGGKANTAKQSDGLEEINTGLHFGNRAHTACGRVNNAGVSFLVFGAKCRHPPVAGEYLERHCRMPRDGVALPSRRARAEPENSWKWLGQAERCATSLTVVSPLSFKNALASNR
jgi:hypothetical protein